MIPENKDTHTCTYCGIDDPVVEAGGMYYCPNPLCPGCGAGWFNASLASYTPDASGNRYTVDGVEQKRRAIAHVYGLPSSALRWKLIGAISIHYPWAVINTTFLGGTGQQPHQVPYDEAMGKEQR